MAPHRTAWVGGSLVPLDKVTVPLLSQSLQRGTLVFDVYHVTWLPSGPHGVGAREHTERFLRSAALLGYPMELTVDELLAVAGQVAQANPGCDSLRLNVLWAEPSADVLPTGDRPVVAVAAYALADLHPGLVAADPPPARLQVPGRRKVPGDVLAVQAKVAASYATGSLAKAAARAAGFHDALLLDGDGHVAEAATMSFFLVTGGVLRAPGLDAVLEGVTRRILLDLAADQKIPVEIGPIPSTDLAVAEEAFLASTSRNVWPVGVLGERILPTPVPGAVTRRLSQRLEAVVAGHDPCATRWLQPLPNQV